MHIENTMYINWPEMGDYLSEYEDNEQPVNDDGCSNTDDTEDVDE